jgi:hypothetical protein
MGSACSSASDSRLLLSWQPTHPSCSWTSRRLVGGCADCLTGSVNPITLGVSHRHSQLQRNVLSGLDARAAAIVMRAVRNTVDTGRTVVCTIHQPSIDIFEVWQSVHSLEVGHCSTYAS